MDDLERAKIESELMPTEELLLELLAARHRLGEAFWHVHARPAVVRAAKALEKLGFIGMQGGQVEKHFRAWLTDRGRELVMDEEYTPPILRQRQLDCYTHPDVGEDHACARCRIGQRHRCILIER